MNAPKISVIIPLYNAERFIRQCLISVLSSKFTNYEVIVVDDCSTDTSVAEVKKLLPHFDGRLKLLQTETNSGSPGLPRNIGIRHAAGKYVTFVDNDDMILPTALGNFVAFADRYEADVVYSEKYFVIDEDKPPTAENFKIAYAATPEDTFDMPTLESSDLRERIRRDFLLENGIDFPQMSYAENLTFCFKCLCLAKNYLHIPTATNVRRDVNSSISKGRVRTPDEGVRRWLKVFCLNMLIIDEFTNGLDFFKQNPACRQDVFNHYVDVHFGMIKKLFHSIPAHELQKIFYDELQNPALDSQGKDLVAACLFMQRALRR